MGNLFTGPINTIDQQLFGVGRTRTGRLGFGGNYTRTSGAGSTGSAAFSGGSFSLNLAAGTAAGGHGKSGWYDPLETFIQGGASTIDYSKRIRFSISGVMYMASTNSKIRIVFSGTGNATDAPFAEQNGLTVKGFGAEFALQSSVIQARLIGFNSAYLTPSSYTTLTNGFGESASDNRFFAVMIESDGAGNINLYAGNSSTVPNIVISPTPLLTLTGGPTTAASSNRFGPEIQCVNHTTVTPTSSRAAELQSGGSWLLDVQ
jgi:hypothetical protein